jgi:excisionase family DNA binding protein
MEALLNIRSAAKLLAVSTWTIRGYIRQGKLHPVRIGRLVRLEEEELLRFVASSKATGDGLQNLGQFRKSEPERRNEA